MRRTRTPLPASHSTAGRTSCSVSVELGHMGVSGGEPVTTIMDSHRISWSVLTVTYIYIFIFPVAFRLYDLDRDDKISRDELLQVSGLVRHVNKTSLYSLWKLLVHAIIKSARWWIIFKTSFLVLKEIIVQYPCQNVTGRCRWEDFALVLIMRRFLTLTTGWFSPDSLKILY